MSTTLRHPARELLARYAAVWRAAWAARHELAGPRRLADEAAFLPAALSLQHSPVHPAPRRAMAVVIVLFLSALVWSVMGHVDVVAVAPGRVSVSGHTKVVQPLEAAVVTAIHVKDGDRVKPGQLLLELDATAPDADVRTLQEQLRSTRSDLQRSGALLQALAAGRPPTTHTLPPDTAALLVAEWADITGKRARHQAEQDSRRAQWRTAQEQLRTLEVTLPLARQREADFQALIAQGFVSGHAAEDRTRERLQTERELQTQRARVQEAEATLRESEQALAAFLAETRRALSERQAQAQTRLTQLTQEHAKGGHRQRLSRLTAPVEGTVQQLAVHTVGGVVTAAQPLLVIVPDDAGLTADVLIDNKDIGFVRAGQAAEVKVETFNFTRYGTLPGRITWVSPDAVPHEQRGSVFHASVALDTDRMEVDGTFVRLGPGMSVTAEVKTGRRRVIEFLLSPIQRRVENSLGER